MSTDKSRRRVLQAIGSTGVISMGMSGIGSANRYSASNVPVDLTQSQASKTLDQYAESTLKLLSEEGIIDRPSIPETRLKPRSVSDIASGSSGVTRMISTPEVLLVSTNIGERTLNIFIDEENKASYATIESEGDYTVYHPSEGQIDLADEEKITPADDCEDECIDPEGCLGEGTYEVRIPIPLLPVCNVDVQCGCP